MTERPLSAVAAALAFALATSGGAAGAAQAPAGGDTPPAEAAPETAPPPDAAAQPAPPPAPPPAADSAKPAPVPPPPAAGAAAAGQAAESWFARPPLTLAMGQGPSRWAVTFFGFIEADYIADTTRSYNDSIGSSLVAPVYTYEAQAGRTQFSMRNTRLGLMFESPTIDGMRPSAVFEGDFFGNQPGTPPTVTESSFFNSPTFRIRHAYLKLETDYVDLVAGQTYDVFGWQNYFNPCSVEFLGLPNQLFSRNPQLRLSHGFGGGDGPVTIEVAAEAARPAQRDGQTPDLEGGVRLNVNSWKGITTPGNVGTKAQPASIGISGIVRQFKVNAFTPPPPQTSNQVTGYGLSVDVFIPLIPAASADDRGNRLSLIGSFVTGTGIADLLTTGGGARFPTLPNPAQANPPPMYLPNIDTGLVTFDQQGVAHTIDWYAFKVGIQYYLPGSGRMIFSANYTQSHSNNMAKLFPMGGAEIELLGRVADTSRYGDVNLFWDATPAVRFGISGQYTQVEYLDSTAAMPDKPHNYRGMGQAVYVF
jgi:hypothetical protein